MSPHDRELKRLRASAQMLARILRPVSTPGAALILLRECREAVANIEREYEIALMAVEALVEKDDGGDQ
jgi:hypothetical protein